MFTAKFSVHRFNAHFLGQPSQVTRLSSWFSSSSHPYPEYPCSTVQDSPLPRGRLLRATSPTC